MTQTYFPFDSGPGSSVTEIQWKEMAQHWMDTGVLLGTFNDLGVYADSSGMKVKVRSGATWIEGHYFKSDAEEIIPIATANATNPRIDRVVIRLDWSTNKISLEVLQGTPAATPVAPALTQNTGRWEFPLAQIRVNAAVATIAANMVTDERTFAQGSVFVSRSRNSFAGDSAHQVYGSADTRVTFPRNEVTRGNVASINSDATFKVNEAGLYMLVVHGQSQLATEAHSFQPRLFKNGAQLRALGDYSFSSTRYSHFYATEILQLVEGDTIEIWIHLNQTAADYTFPYIQIQIAKVR
ncbi:hypothetical protein [Bacillus sp. UNC322MFChir4.1]|uniref:hypothetical protein n=1 Tax=Bacillus sp. UNC322MFChir4.1 TaxID=1449045 RepID=UPI0005546619|nr:hypothetical protein [Bacillus sp. UNC322MFChir4.1]